MCFCGVWMTVSVFLCLRNVSQLRSRSFSQNCFGIQARSSLTAGYEVSGRSVAKHVAMMKHAFLTFSNFIGLRLLSVGFVFYVFFTNFVLKWFLGILPISNFGCFKSCRQDEKCFPRPLLSLCFWWRFVGFWSLYEGCWCVVMVFARFRLFLCVIFIDFVRFRAFADWY